MRFSVALTLVLAVRAAINALAHAARVAFWSPLIAAWNWRVWDLSAR
jgi:hypothetical protein